jgi:hypothetical protein
MTTFLANAGLIAPFSPPVIVIASADLPELSLRAS